MVMSTRAVNTRIHTSEHARLRQTSADPHTLKLDLLLWHVEKGRACVYPAGGGAKISTCHRCDTLGSVSTTKLSRQIVQRRWHVTPPLPVAPNTVRVAVDATHMYSLLQYTATHFVWDLVTTNVLHYLYSWTHREYS